MKIGFCLAFAFVLFALFTACADKPPAEETPAEETPAAETPAAETPEDSPETAVEQETFSKDPVKAVEPEVPYYERTLPPFRRVQFGELTEDQWDALGRAIADPYPLFLCAGEDDAFRELFDTLSYAKDKLIIANPTEVIEFDDGMIITHGRLLRGKIVIKFDDNQKWISVNDYPLVFNTYDKWMDEASSFQGAISDLNRNYGYLLTGGEELLHKVAAFREKAKRLQEYVSQHYQENEKDLIQYVTRELKQYDPSLQIKIRKRHCTDIEVTMPITGSEAGAISGVHICSTPIGPPSEEFILHYNANSYYGKKLVLKQRKKIDPHSLSLIVTAFGNIFIDQSFPTDAQIDAIVKADIDLREKYYRLYQLLLPIYKGESADLALFSKYLIEERGGLTP